MMKVKITQTPQASFCLGDAKNIHECADASHQGVIQSPLDPEVYAHEHTPTDSGFGYRTYPCLLIMITLINKLEIT